MVLLSSSIQKPKYYTKLGCHCRLSSSLPIRRYVVCATEESLNKQEVNIFAEVLLKIFYSRGHRFKSRIGNRLS
jgi:hypothetical protein